MIDNLYDVTTWPRGDAHQDIGEVINDIISDIKAHQNRTDVDGGGRPGAAILIPSGDYHLRTQVIIDISYLKIMGTGHGFVSSSIRFNTPRDRWPDMHDLWPGGSRILVDLEPDGTPRSGVAFLIERDGEPRISSVEFENFCIDGLHFVADGTETDPENTYLNGKTGIMAVSPHDSFRINGMGLVYLEHGIVMHHADALSIHDNFIAECGNCIELLGSGQASKITDNLIGAGYRGHSISAEHFGGLLIAGNNVFPRGADTVRFLDVARSSITANRFHAFYPGVIELKGICCENLVSSNHIYRSHEPWAPMFGLDNGLDDTHGLITVEGNNNTIVANHISDIIDTEHIRPAGAVPVAIRISAGTGNYIASNHIFAATEAAPESDSDSCFDAQVGAMTAIANARPIDITAVIVDDTATGNIVLDSGTDSQITANRQVNVVRPLPSDIHPSTVTQTPR